MKGKCFCGAVSIVAKDAKEFEACHCSICRNWSGAPFMGVDGGKSPEIVGEESVKRFSSSDWAERGFCANCGTHLFYHLLPTGDYILPVGLFPEIKDLNFKEQIFIDKKPHYYCFANETEMLTEAQVFAKYAQL